MQQELQNISPIKQRILQFLESLNISKRKFYEFTGISRGTLESYTGITEETLAKFIAAYPMVNQEWLIRGIGMMVSELNDTTIKAYRSPDNTGVPLIPVSAMAGYAVEDVQVMYESIQERYVIPEFHNKGVKYLIRASGSSMYPKYSNGDLLACRPIEDISFSSGERCTYSTLIRVHW